MTRAVDRLIVSGSLDRGRAADERTPIGWVLARLDAPEELVDGLLALPGGAQLVVRVDRFSPAADVAVPGPAEEQLSLFEAGTPEEPFREVPPLPELAP